MVTLSAGEDRYAQGEHQRTGRQPFPLAQVELVALRIVVIGHLHGQGRQVCVLLHADLFGQHFGLGGQLAHLGVAVQGSLLPLVDVVEHVGGVVFQGAGHVDVHIQVHAHHGFELPQGQRDGILCIVQVGDRRGHAGLRTGQVHFGGLLGIVAHLGELEVLYGILVHGVVHIVRGLGHEHGEEGLLDRRNRSQTAFPGLFNSQFHLVAGEPEALPQLDIHQRHGGRQAEGDLVATAHLDRVAAGGSGFFLGRSNVRDKRRTGYRVQLLDIIHNGLEGRHEHGGHAAATARRTLAVVVRAEEHLLFLDGIAVHAGGADLGEQGAVSAFACILVALDFHIRHFHGHILGEGNLEGVVQGEHQGAVRVGTVLRIKLSLRCQGKQEHKQEKAFFYTQKLTYRSNLRRLFAAKNAPKSGSWHQNPQRYVKNRIIYYFYL